MRNISKIAKPLNDLLGGGGKLTKTRRKGELKVKPDADEMAKW